MRNSTKFWLLSSAALVIAGSTIFTATACAIGWDFSKFNTTTLETNTHTLHDDFNNIAIDVDTADLTIRPSENGECKVVCHEDVKQRHSVIVENGTLTIQENDERAWYDYISTGINDISVTVYLPKTQYIALSIETHTGDIEIPNGFTFDSVDISGSTCDVDFSASVANTLSINITTGDITLSETTADSISLTVSTGDINLNKVAIANALNIKTSTGSATLNHVSCKTFTHDSNSGDLNMTNVLATEKMDIKTSTGDVEFEHCDAGEIDIETSTGDVEGSLLSGKNFQADSDTGDVKTPASTEGGKCEIHSSTGDIRITVIS